MAKKAKRKEIIAQQFIQGNISKRMGRKSTTRFLNIRNLAKIQVSE